MIKYFQRAFKITNENIILATPLVLFLFLLSIYMGVAQNAPSTLMAIILLSITILFMLSAFFGGWLFMVKKAIDLDKQEFIIDEDKAKASFALLKEIPIGIGEYFFPFIGLLILYSLLFILFIYIGFQLGLHLIGKVGVSVVQLKAALETTAAMKALISGLSAEQLSKLNAWNMLLMSVLSIFSFITMFWAPQVVLRTKNPATALFKAIKFTFKNFLAALIIFIYVSLINFMISLVNAFSTVNPILYFISMLVYFYFVVYIVVLVFLYYDRESNKLEYVSKNEFTESNCAKGNCDCGTDGIGQDQNGNTNCKDE